MDDRQEQFLTLYHTYRHKDQVSYYKNRHEEFEQARRQAVILAGMLLFLTAMASILTTTNLFWPKSVWAVLSVLLPALSTALTAYNSLYAFEPQSKLYQDAFRALHKAEAGIYDVRQAADQADYQARLEAYVNQVEEVFRKEQAQWGQLISELKPAQPPKPKETKK